MHDKNSFTSNSPRAVFLEILSFERLFSKFTGYPFLQPEQK